MRDMKTALIFADIDNTVWDWQHVLPDSTREAFARLKEKGHFVFLNSGRSRGHIFDPKLISLPMKGIVAACGTHIEADGKLLYEQYLPWDVLQKALALLREESMPYILEGREYLWMDVDEFPHDAYVERLFRELKERAKHLSELRPEDRVNKFSAAATEKTDMARIERELEGTFTLLKHNETVAEFIPAGSGKGVGIERVCRLLDIPRENTYAIGDSVNDLDMFRYAAHGICMGNGTEALKREADLVTASMEEDGIERALIQLGLIGD